MTNFNRLLNLNIDLTHLPFFLFCITVYNINSNYTRAYINLVAVCASGLCGCFCSASVVRGSCSRMRLKYLHNVCWLAAIALRCKATLLTLYPSNISYDIYLKETTGQDVNEFRQYIHTRFRLQKTWGWLRLRCRDKVTIRYMANIVLV